MHTIKTQRKVKRIRRLRNSVVVLCLVIFSVASFELGRLSAQIEQAEREQRARSEYMQSIADMKAQEEREREEQAKRKREAEDKILACLLYLESTNRHDIVILDSNNQYSIGGYQFQVATVRDILARYEQKHVTEAQAVKIAKSPSESKELARRAIFKYQLWPKWYNSFQKMKAGSCKDVNKVELSTLMKK